MYWFVGLHHYQIVWCSVGGVQIQAGNCSIILLTYLRALSVCEQFYVRVADPLMVDYILMRL